MNFEFKSPNYTLKSSFEAVATWTQIKIHKQCNAWLISTYSTPISLRLSGSKLITPPRSVSTKQIQTHNSVSTQKQFKLTIANVTSIVLFLFGLEIDWS